MCRGVEFPEQILNEMLTHEPDDVRIAILRALISRPHLSSNLLDLTASFLREDYGNSHVRLAAIETLSCQSSLPDNIFQALVSGSNDCCSVVWQSATEALGRQLSLPDNNMQAMVSRLHDGNSFERMRAIEDLGRQPSLPNDILQILVSKFYDGGSVIREIAIQLLRRQSSLPDNSLQALISRLDDSNFLTRQAAIQALGRQSSLRGIELISIDHRQFLVRQAAIKTLGQQPSLPDNILQALVSRLDDGDSDIRGAAIGALDRQSSLPDNILQNLISQLDDHWFEIGFQVEEVLRKHDSFYSTFPRLHTQTLLALYRIWVIKAFSGQFSFYMRDGVLYIDVPDRRRRIPLQRGEVFKEFLTAATEMGSPSLCADKYLEA